MRHNPVRRDTHVYTDYTMRHQPGDHVYIFFVTRNARIKRSHPLPALPSPAEKILITGINGV